MESLYQLHVEDFYFPNNHKLEKIPYRIFCTPSVNKSYFGEAQCYRSASENIFQINPVKSHRVDEKGGN